VLLRRVLEGLSTILRPESLPVNIAVITGTNSVVGLRFATAESIPARYHGSQMHVRGQLFLPCLYNVLQKWLPAARKGTYKLGSGVFRPLAKFSVLRYGCTGKSPPTPQRCQIPSPHHWKSKCGEDIDSSTSLRHHRESSDLQRRFIGNSQAGTFLTLAALIDLIVQLDSTRTLDGG